MTKIDSFHSVLVLLSGGIDSSALIQYHLSQGDKVEGVFFNYGQKSYNQELLSAQKVSNHYNVKLHHKDLGFQLNNYNGEYYCRNGLFILAACGFLKNPPSLISIGIHSGTPFYDSSLCFIENMQSIIDGYFGGTTRILAPFIDFSKKQVYEYVVQHKVPIEFTYSCELGKEHPCGICLSCIDRRLLVGTPSS